MTDEAGIGPSEVQVNSLSFQQLCRFRIFDEKPETLSPRERYQLIATCSKYGYSFVGSNADCVKVIRTDDLARISEENQDSAGCPVVDYPHGRLATPGRPLHISVNCDETVLSVITKTAASLKLVLFDLLAVCQRASSVQPITAAGLTKEADIDLVDLLWNPFFSSLFAVCLSDGSTNLWVWSEGKISHLSALPSAIIANAACWSPKGKQIVIGTADGMLMQFNHTMEHKKTVSKPDFANEAVKVVDILWLSTYMWVVAYIDDDETIQPNIAIVHAPKEQPASFMNFEDICYGSGEDRKAKYYMKFLDKWGFLVTSSSNAMETGILGQRPDNKTSWDIWTLEDTGRIELPLCDDEDTLPMGFALDFTAQREFITVTKQKHAPVPILLILSTEGLLCPFHVINAEAKESLQQKPEQVPGGAQQIVNTSASDGKPAGMTPSGSSQATPSAAPSSTAQQPTPSFSFNMPLTTNQAPSSTVANTTTTSVAAPFSFKMPQTTNQAPTSTDAKPATTLAAAPFSFKPPQPAASTSGFTFGSTFGGGFGGSSPFSTGGAMVTHPTDEAAATGGATLSKPFSFTHPSASTTEGTGSGSSQAQTTSGAFSFTTPATTAPTAATSTTSAATAPGATSFSFTKPANTNAAGQTSAGASLFSFTKPSTTTTPSVQTGTSASQPKPVSFAQPQAAASGPPGQATGGAAPFSFTTKPAAAPSDRPSGVFPSFSFAKSTVPGATSSTGQSAATPAFAFKPPGMAPQSATPSTSGTQGVVPSGSFSFVKPQAQVVQPTVPSQQTAPTTTPTTQPPSYKAPAAAIVTEAPKRGPPNQVAPVMRTLPFNVTEEQQRSSQVTLPRVQDAPKTPGNLSVTIPIEQRKGAMQGQRQPSTAPAGATVAPQAERPALSGVPPAAVRERYAPVVEPVSPTSSVATSVGGEHLESALMSNIQDEIEHFDKEIEDLCFRTESGKCTIGRREDLFDIRRSVDDLEAFRADVLECTKMHEVGGEDMGLREAMGGVTEEALTQMDMIVTESLNEDVHSIKSKLLNSFALLEESKIRKQRNRDPRFITLLKARGLDPQTSAQMQEIQGMIRYLEVGTRDVNRSLDLQWEEKPGQGKKAQSRKLATPTMDTIYHTLRNHHNIMATQRIALESVREKLMKAQKYDPIGSLYGGALPSPKFKSDDVGPLALRLSETKLNSSRRTRQTPASSKKQSMLRDILSRRTQTPIRSSPKVLSREDEVSSPSLSYSSERSYTPPITFSKKLDFTDDARPAASGPAASQGAPPVGRGVSESRFQQAITPAKESTPVKEPARGSLPPAYPKPGPAAHPTPVGGSTTTRVPPMGVPAAAGRVPARTTAAPQLPPPAASSVTTKAVPQKVVVTSAPPSSFAHTGTGTVLWGAEPSKATNPSQIINPSQMAYAAAMSRISPPKGPGAAGEPINPNLPPNVNIKNFDSMKATMPPPVTFAAVASSVDADTAQVVTQVLSEITSTGGRAIPPPGTAVTDTLQGSTKSSESPQVTSTDQSIPRGLSSKTFVIPPKEAVAEAPKSGGSLLTPVASSTPIDSVTTTGQPAKFDFSLKNDSSSSSASATVPGGFLFGSKLAGEKSASAGLSFVLPKADTTAAGSVNKAPSSSNTSLRGLLADEEEGDEGPSGEMNPPASSSTSKPPGAAPTGFSFGSTATSQPPVSGTASSQPFSSATSKPAFGGISTSSTPFGGSSGFSFGQKPVTTLAPGSASAFSQPAFGQAPTTKVTTPAMAAVQPDKVTVAPNRVAPGAEKALAASASPSLTPGSFQFRNAAGSSATKPESETESAGQFVFEVKKAPSSLSTASIGSAPLDAPSASTPSVSTPGISSPTAGMKSTSSAPSLLTGLLKSSSVQPASAPDTTTATPSSATTQQPSTTSAPFSFDLGGTGARMTTTVSPFGVAAAPSTTTAAASGFSFAASSTPTSLFSGAAGGFGSTATAAKPSLFGQAAPTTGFGAASSTPATTTTAQSLFEQSASTTTSQSLFGQQSTTPQSGFGQTATFGSGGPTLFGQKPAFGQTPSSTSVSKSLFGQTTASSSATPGPFGQPVQATPASSQPSMGGFGGFGLGGKPDPEAAKINPFGVASSTGSTTGSFGTPNLFGGQASKAFGSPTNTGSGFGGGSAFGTSSTASAGSGGFGTQPANTAASSGFGSAPVFGGAPAFGSKPAFGSPPAFGSGAAFSSPMGQSTFGSNPSSGGVFGATANQNTASPGFGGFASQNTPSFGGLASSPQQGFGATTGASGGFGSPQQTGFGGFGNTSGGFGNSNTNTSFGGGTSGSFSQYR